MAENKQVVVSSKEIETGMMNWIKEAEEQKIKFPVNYSAENAVKSAMLILSETKTGKETGYKPVLEVCTKKSIAYSLQKMLTWGLNPAKKQLYFIAFGDKLGIMESYFGVYAMAKRMANIVEINCAAVFKGDIFEFEIKNGVKNIKEHKQTLESLGSEMIAVYAVVIYADGKTKTEIMTMDQVKKSWAKSTYGFNKQTHGEFAEDMAKRTVLKKAVKLDVNSSDDSYLFMEDDTEITDNVKEEIKSTEKTVINIEELAETIEPVTIQNIESPVKEEKLGEGGEIVEEPEWLKNGN